MRPKKQSMADVADDAVGENPGGDQQPSRMGTFHWTQAGDRMVWSEEMCLLAGVAPNGFAGTLEGMLDVVHPRDRVRVRECIEAAMRDREPFRLRLRIVRPDNVERTVDCIGAVDLEDAGNPTGIHGVCVDFSAGEGSDRRFNDSDERFRMLVSQVKDYAIFMLDTTGHIVSWNEGAQRIKGWTENEIVGQSMTKFYTSEDVQRGHPAHLLGIAKTEGRVEDEGWRVRKDGSRFWADVVITALRDDGGQLRGFGKVTRDLTERRETELALAELSSRLLELQDDERRRISRELHDSTSPLLTGLMSRLHTAKLKSKGAEAGLTAVLDDAIASAEATTTVIRSVAALLHPPLLDESGVLASLRWYAKALSGRRDMKLDLDFPPTMDRLPRDMEIAIFRTVQESLGNIMQAVGAKHVKVYIRLKDRMLSLGIEGDGLPGGGLAELRAGRGDLGIAVAGMRERMRKLGGKLLVSSEGGRLSISISLPLPEHRVAARG